MAYFKPVMWVDVVPVTGGTVNVPITDAGTPVNVCLNHTALIAALTIAFPVTGVQDGQIVKIASKSAVLAVTMNVESGGFLQGLLTALVGAGEGIYQFRKDNATWYKFSA